MSRTGGPPARPRCPLERMLPAGPDTEELKRRAWTEHQVLVINVDDPQLSWDERETVRQLGGRIYGNR